MLDTVETTADVTCTLTATVSPECPVHDETDRYEVTVEWDTDGITLEKHDLHRYLTSFNGTELTQEQLVSEIADTVRDAGIRDATVTAQDIRHMDMEVTA